MTLRVVKKMDDSGPKLLTRTLGSHILLTLFRPHGMMIGSILALMH